MQNDHDLFIEYYELYKNKVFTYLMYRLNFNREVSEDLLMDIVLKAYEKFNSYNSKKGSFKNWIFAIAHNQLLNYWRDQGKKKTERIDNVYVNDRLAEYTDNKMEQELIRKVLKIMDKNNSELITLKYIYDFNNKEISKILKKREGAVRTGLTRAISQFKKLYEKLNNN